MQSAIFLALSDCTVVFARNLEGFYVNEGTAVFNAPRPLLGGVHTCQDWCHGRHYSEVDLADPFASGYIQKNIDLDARIVFPVTDAEAVEMLLMNNRHADKYREWPFAEQLDMLLPQFSKIQHLSYGEAVGLLDAARALLTSATSELDRDPLREPGHVRSA
jgi:hypothetical protein